MSKTLGTLQVLSVCTLPVLPTTGFGHVHSPWPEGGQVWEMVLPVWVVLLTGGFGLFPRSV